MCANREFFPQNREWLQQNREASRTSSELRIVVRALITYAFNEAPRHLMGLRDCTRTAASPIGRPDQTSSGGSPLGQELLSQG
jgi:hypothetical protein